VSDQMSGQEQLTLARINASVKAHAAVARVQAVAVVMVGTIIVGFIAGSAWLTNNSKPVPDWWSTTISIAITGLVGVLSFNAGKNSKDKEYD